MDWQKQYEDESGNVKPDGIEIEIIDLCDWYARFADWLQEKLTSLSK
jgi:hypothetical protein